MTALFTLQPGRWYALQQLGYVEPVLSWEAATPVLMTGVTPLKAGEGAIELELVRAFAKLGPASERLSLRVVYRSADVIIATGNGWCLAPMTIAITAISIEWLNRFCPRLLKRYEPFDHYFYGLDGGPTAQVYLAHHLGQTPQALTVEPRVPDAEKLGTMPAEHGRVPFSRSYAGLDAWLLLRPVIPADMDYKWLIVSLSKPDGGFSLRFHRSWTGILIYEVSFTYDGTNLGSTEAVINLDERQYGYGAPETEVTFLEWLIDFWLLGTASSDAPPFGNHDRQHARDTWADHMRSLEHTTPSWLLTQPAQIPESS